MTHIDEHWRDYFTNPDEGLGTTYERFVLHRFFSAIDHRFTVRTVLEAPLFGMTGISGINSLWWVLRGKFLTMIDHDEERLRMIQKLWDELDLNVTASLAVPDFNRLEFDDGSFDLGWNFAAMWYVPHPERFLAELTRVCTRAIFICVPNTTGIFHQFRRRRLKKERRLFQDHIRPKNIRQWMSGLGWHEIQADWFDVPPWPDIAMKKEDLLRRMGLSSLAGRFEDSGRPVCILDHYTGRDSNLKSAVMRYDLLERSPVLFKAFWAHHRGFLFVPSRPSEGNEAIS